MRAFVSELSVLSRWFLSLLMPELHCLAYCCSVVSFEIGKYASSTSDFFKAVLSVLDPVHFPLNLGACLSEDGRHSSRDWTGSVGCLGFFFFSVFSLLRYLLHSDPGILLNQQLAARLPLGSSTTAFAFQKQAQIPWRPSVQAAGSDPLASSVSPPPPSLVLPSDVADPRFYSATSLLSKTFDFIPSRRVTLKVCSSN